MKRAKSGLIERFVMHVDDGLITGRDASSGPAILKRMRDALQAILDGDSPDKALAVERGKGPGSDPKSLPLAWAIHRARKNGDTWDVIKCQADKWLSDRGERPISRTRLIQLYKEQLAEIEKLESWQEFDNFLRRSS